MSSDAEQPVGARDEEVLELVDRHVRPLIAWYQTKKRWPRRLYRATTVAVIALGASIPLLIIGEGECSSRLLTAAVGVTISGLTGLATVTDWQRRWQIFTGAQTSLEVRLADWELAIAEAGMAEPERARQMKLDATKELMAAAMAIRQSEMDAFFAGQPQVTDGAVRSAGLASP